MSINFWIAFIMLVSGFLFSADSYDNEPLVDNIPISQAVESENLLDSLPPEIICHIAEYLPSAHDLEMVLLATNNTRQIKALYWTRKAQEDFGPIKNKTILKSIESALGKRNRKNLPQTYEETIYKKTEEIFLKKNIAHFLKNKVFIQPRGNNIYRTYFKGAHFININLSGYIFCEGNFTAANFSEALLIESDMRWTKCIGTNFHKAILIRAKVGRSDFSDANFSEANVSGTDFRDTTLSRTNFAGANVTDTVFPQHMDANFTGAFFFSQEGNKRYQVFLNAHGSIIYKLLIE